MWGGHRIVGDFESACHYCAGRALRVAARTAVVRIPDALLVEFLQGEREAQDFRLVVGQKAQRVARQDQVSEVPAAE